MSSQSVKPQEFLNRPLRFIIIWSSVFLFAFFIWSAAEARKTASNRVVDWLPAGTEEIQTFYKYYHHFPEGELLMVSWVGCNTDDVRLDTVADQLTAPLAAGSPAYFERVLSTRSILNELTEEVQELRPAEIRSRLSDWLIGHNGKDACLIAFISPTGSNNRTAAIETVFSTVEKMTGLPRSEIYVAGPTIDSVAIDAISEKSQTTLLPFFLLFCFVLLLCCLRNFFAALIVFGVALMNEELAGAVLFWFGAHVDSISLLNSSLVYVLTISGGVHLINYYRETLQETTPGEETHAPRQMLKKAVLPCTLAVITTVLGMGSLAVSKMIPIQTFGIYASLTLLIGTLWLFLFVTTILQQYPIRRWYRAKPETETSEIPSKQGWKCLGGSIFRYRTVITVLAFLLMFGLAFGVKNLRTSITFHGLLPDSAKVIQDYNVLENKIGGLIPVEVVVHVPDANNETITLLDQLYLLEALRNILNETKDVDAVVSVLNFLPNLPSQTGRSMSQSARRAAMTGILNRRQERLREIRFFDRTPKLTDESIDDSTDESTDDSPGTYWRLSLRISSQASIDYAVLMTDIRNRLESIRTAEVVSKMSGIQFDATGGVPLVHHAQEQLLRDLIDSFTAAFGLITLMMIVMLRGIVRGLLAMVPNIFPCIIVFGTLGLLNIPIDMGSMMTASVAMGISVDGTLHFLTWFHIGLKRGLERRQSVLFAYQHCATALLQTTIICGFGMLVFGLSDFVPVSRFAVLLCLLLIASLIGDIIVLPAILFGPLGRFFESKKGKLH